MSVTHDPLVVVESQPVDIGKSFTVKTEKDDESNESNFAYLTFKNLFLSRDQIDKLLGRAPGWAQACFYDEQGAPTLAATLVLDGSSVAVSGVVRGRPDDPVLPLKQADLQGIELSLAQHGAHLSGKLRWIAAGDEVSDVDALLGKTCIAEWNIFGDPQGDLLKDAA